MPERSRKGAMMEQAMTLLTKIGTRMLLINEIHNTGREE
ncbi:MAG: hypothetical protein HQM06_15810 [Magnetococcales bacterium]|nr:hypothetical protein [Magnetococcales bacterium]